MVDDQTDIILITDSGIIIRIPADQISKQSRYAGGVKVMRVDDQTSIIGIAVTEKEEESEETEDTASLPESAQPSALEDSDKAGRTDQSAARGGQCSRKKNNFVGSRQIKKHPDL